MMEEQVVVVGRIIQFDDDDNEGDECTGKVESNNPPQNAP